MRQWCRACSPEVVLVGDPFHMRAAVVEGPIGVPPFDEQNIARLDFVGRPCGGWPSPGYFGSGVDHGTGPCADVLGEVRPDAVDGPPYAG